MTQEQRNPLRSRGDDLAVITGLVLLAALAVRVIPEVRARIRASGTSPDASSDAGRREGDDAGPRVDDRPSGHLDAAGGGGDGMAAPVDAPVR